MNLEYFGKLIRTRREEMNMTQRELAKACGLSVQSIGTLEHTGICRLENAVKAAKALKLNAIPVE